MANPHSARVDEARRLSEPDLLQHTLAGAQREREATVAVLAYLAECDRRRLHLEAGFTSIFSYCTTVLRLAEYSASNRIAAARACRRFPVVLERLADGSLNLGTLRLLAPHLEQDNHQALLDGARGRSRRYVEAMVAALAPMPEVPPSIQKQLVLAPVGAPRPTVAPIAAERYRVQFTVGQATNDKLRQAQDLLRREVPDGDPGAIFDRALSLLLEDVARTKMAETTNPRPARPADPQSRHVPAHVKRAVWLRDSGRCAFVADGGQRCEARAYLEFHHVDPFGHGGETTADNLSLRCSAHNAHEAERVFGS
jgi:hypothetical protein